MRPVFYTISAFILAACACFAEDAPASPTLDELLAPQIKKLNDDNFDSREGAEKAILEIAREREERVTAILRTARAKIADDETRQRLEKIEAKLKVTGDVDWSVEAGQIYQLPAISGGNVFVANKDNTLFCLNALDGKVLWTYAVAGFLYKSLAVADGRVFIIRTRRDGRPDGTVIALDAATGRELWAWQDGKKSQYFTAPIVADGSLYFAREKALIRLNATTGKTVWSFDSGDSILSPPSIASGRVLFGTLEGDLVCLNDETGEKFWSAELAGPVYSGGIVSDGRVFAGGGNSLYRIDLKSGDVMWEFRGNETVTTASAAKGAQVFASFGMVFRCVDAEKGRVLWDKETSGHIFAAPAVTGNRVYVGSLNDKLTMYCFDASSGEELWTHVTKEGGYAEPILAGRRLFIGYHSKFYPLKTGLPGPASWPMSGGNPGRSGCNDK